MFIGLSPHHACLSLLLASWIEGKVAASPATQSAEHGEEPPAATTSPRQEVRVDVVSPAQHGLGRKTVQPGTVHAFEYAELYAKTSGYLGEQTVDIGDRVTATRPGSKKGVIEALRELKAGVDAAAGLWRAANSAQAQTEARLLTQRAEAKAALATVKQADAEVVRAKAQVVYRKSQYGRIKELVASESVEKKLEDEQHEAYESSEATLLSAHAAVENAKAQADAAQARVTQAEADIEHAKAEVQVAAAVLSKAKVLWNYTKIESPYDGVITLRKFHRGAFILSADDGGTMPLLTVAHGIKCA